MHRNLLLASLIAIAACAPTFAAEPLTLVVEEATVAQLQARMQAGALDSHTLTQAYLERIAALDDAGPMLGAVIELNPRALAEAGALDAERLAGHVRGALHGIPVLLKDNLDATPMVAMTPSWSSACATPAP